MDVVVAPRSSAPRSEYLMSSTATRFLAQIRRNVESWRADEIDYVTFIESQRDTWAGIQAAGAHVEVEVLRALSGSTSVANLLMPRDTQRTAQVPVDGVAALPPARRYCALLARTAAGGPVLKVLATDPRNRHGGPRQVAAMIYEIAADMERRSQQLEAHWTITADPENGQVVIELTGDHETALADELVANVMTEHQLL